MFEPSATDPPIRSVSADQRHALQSYFGNCIENDRGHRSHPLDFALLLAGEKPACTMHPSKEEFPDDPFHPAAGLRRLCDQFDLALHKPREVSWWFVAPVDGRLDLLPSGNRCPRNEAWHRRLGVVLGYPPSAVEAFIRRLTTHREWTEPNELVHEGHFTPEEIAYAGVVPYRYDDSITGYEQAIRDGKRVRECLDHHAERWAVPELADCVTDRWEHQRNEAQKMVTP
jgi:hypothetical protein